MSASEISKEKLISLVVDILPPGQPVDPSADFKNFGLQSLDLIQFYVDVQSHFDVSFAIEEVLHLKSIDELYSFILDRKQREE